MAGSIISQGSFVSDGTSSRLNLRQGVDWVYVYNYTQAAAAQTTAVGVKYYWQRGFPAGAAWVTYKSNAANATQLESVITSGGFTLYDSSLQAPGQLNATITAISAASIPVVTNTGTNGLVAGDVVRLINVASAQQVGGLDFTVGYNTLSATTFSLDYMPQIVAGTTGSWRKINYDPIFYPRRRIITKITRGTDTIVTMSVTHGYKVGQQVRFAVSPVFGMTEINNMVGNIVAIDTTATTGNTITVDIDSSAFTPFVFAVSADAPFTPAEVIPVGEDTATALLYQQDILSDATRDTSSMGIILGGGAGFPGGASGDTMYYVTGTSIIVENE